MLESIPWNVVEHGIASEVIPSLDVARLDIEVVDRTGQRTSKRCFATTTTTEQDETLGMDLLDEFMFEPMVDRITYIESDDLITVQGEETDVRKRGEQPENESGQTSLFRSTSSLIC